MAKKSPPKVSDVVGAVHRIAPPQLAESWDNVGLQFGDPDRPAGRIMTALEAGTAVLDEMEQREIGTLVTHHPLLFKPPKSMAEISTVAKLSARVIRANCALIAAHTNFDSVANGTNGVLADRLGLKPEPRKFLRPAPPHQPNVKLVVTVPEEHAQALFEALAKAGAGNHDNYSHASFQSLGAGTFKPLEGANPERGEVGRIEQVAEVRMEFLVPKKRIDRVAAALIETHPYEVPAFDFQPLEPVAKPAAGLGLIGELPEPITLEQFAKDAKVSVGSRSVGVVGDLDSPVCKVALCSGAGGDLIRNWRQGTADVFVTGEMNHHDCQEAEERGVPVVLLGHWASEAIASPRLAELISQELAAAGWKEESVLSSEREHDPLERI